MFKLEFDTHNAAFSKNPAAESTWVLLDITHTVLKNCGNYQSGPVKDSDGNVIGQFLLDSSTKLRAKATR